MKVIYIANDGRVFTNEGDCAEYEWWLDHPHIRSVLFFDKDNQAMPVSMDDILYSQCMKVIVPDEYALQALHELADYCGWVQFESDINSAGVWVWDFSINKFVKQ